MKTKMQIWITSFVIPLLMTGCLDEIFLEGNGILRTETRSVAYIDEVLTSGDFTVTITQGEQYEVKVEAESNLIPYITTHSSRGKLSVGVKGVHNLHNNLPMKVFVVTPQIYRLALSGSGEIISDFFSTPDFKVLVSGSGKITASVDADDIDVDISGSGRVNLEGGAGKAEIRVSGSGEFDGYDLLLTDCESFISGSGRIYVNVLRTLTATISGSGTIYYIGNPFVHTSISGSGRVINDNE